MRVVNIARRESTDSISPREQEELEFGVIQELWKPFETMLWWRGLFLFVVDFIGHSAFVICTELRNGTPKSWCVVGFAEDLNAL